MSDIPVRYRALRLRLTVATVLLAVIPVMALGLFIHYQFSRTYEERLVENLRLMASNKRDAIDMFLDERVCQLHNLASTHTFVQLSDKAYLTDLFDKVNACSNSFIDMGIIDENGDHSAYVGPYALGNVNYREEDWFRKTMLKGLYISDVFLGFRNYPHFIIAVKRRDGAKTWVLRATIDSEVFTDLVRSVQVGRSGDAYIVNYIKELQTPSRFHGGVLAKAKIPEGNELGREVSILRFRQNNVGMIGAETRIEHTGWKLIITEDANESVSPLLRTQRMVFIVLTATGLAIMLGTLGITGRLTRKLMATERERAALDATMLQTSKMASLGKLAAGVAHEINNPLTIIREAAGWMRDVINDGGLEGASAVEDIEEGLNDIERHVERAREVTHRMLGFARRMEPFQENVDLNALATQTAKFLENESLHRNIEIGFDLSPTLPRVVTDANQVQQVVLNLLENAIDAMDRDGRIGIRSWSEGTEVFLSVSDTGPGIASEHQNRVFDPFFTTKAPGEGTGLGLSIIYSTVKRLGGDITLSSPPGKGATFTIRLPLDGRATQSREEE